MDIKSIFGRVKNGNVKNTKLYKKISKNIDMKSISSRAINNPIHNILQTKGKMGSHTISKGIHGNKVKRFLSREKLEHHG